MDSQEMTHLFPVSSRYFNQKTRDLLFRTKAPVSTWPGFLADHPDELGIPPFVSDLVRLEQAFKNKRETSVARHAQGNRIEVNPSLETVSVAWAGLPDLLLSPDTAPEPVPHEEEILVWNDPGQHQARIETAGQPELLALKTVSERLDPEAIAKANGVPVGVIDGAIARAIHKGMLLSPPSDIIRHSPRVVPGSVSVEPFRTAGTFTLQWHITQRCDLACKHCYDRTDRVPMTLAKGLEVLDKFRRFCRTRFVNGQVTFTGGNPFLHPDFHALYQAAFERHLQVAILGNPVPRKPLERIMKVTPPAFYQVSLEGLEEHNDTIRGPGHFERTMRFLDLLREMRIRSRVMLTLTRANLDQVLPLGEVLRERADGFSFNRLAPFGEGSSLLQADPSGFESFCRDYFQAALDNPVLNLKDNLFCIPVQEAGVDQFGGCTGFGCGAAFNFVSLLSDGEVHACRKLPSPLGNIFETDLDTIYESPLAEKYRQGATACRDCSHFAVCGGCMAVAAGSGLDPFTDRDPFCPLPQ